MRMTLERRTDGYESELETGIEFFSFTKIRVMRFYFSFVESCAMRGCFLQVLQDGGNPMLGCGVARDEVRRDKE